MGRYLGGPVLRLRALGRLEMWMRR